REAADGLRLPPADDLFPARRAGSADDRADRERGEGDAGRVLRRADRDRARSGRVTRAAPRRAARPPGEAARRGAGGEAAGAPLPLRGASRGAGRGRAAARGAEGGLELPEVGEHLGVSALAVADHEQLEPVRPGLEAAGDLRGAADRVPLPDVANLVLDLHATASCDDDVDLFVRPVAVRDRRPEARRELLVAEAAAAEPGRLPGEPRLPPPIWHGNEQLSIVSEET